MTHPFEKEMLNPNYTHSINPDFIVMVLDFLTAEKEHLY